MGHINHDIKYEYFIPCFILIKLIKYFNLQSEVDKQYIYIYIYNIIIAKQYYY